LNLYNTLNNIINKNPKNYIDNFNTYNSLKKYNNFYGFKLKDTLFSWIPSTSSNKNNITLGNEDSFVKKTSGSSDWNLCV